MTVIGEGSHLRLFPITLYCTDERVTFQFVAVRGYTVPFTTALKLLIESNRKFAENCFFPLHVNDSRLAPATEVGWVMFTAAERVTRDDGSTTFQLSASLRAIGRYTC